mmetsp:Transcript_4049/g.12800  ORF Transcript_4049/g.12800 Transcript_4049/m.12800 type:complete len:163 (-) Transcript_4049:7-495(-)
MSPSLERKATTRRGPQDDGMVVAATRVTVDTFVCSLCSAPVVPFKPGLRWTSCACWTWPEGTLLVAMLRACCTALEPAEVSPWYSSLRIPAGAALARLDLRSPRSLGQLDAGAIGLYRGSREPGTAALRRLGHQAAECDRPLRHGWGGPAQAPTAAERRSGT